MGELSHAARVLRSGGLAPGTADTVRELTDPQARPPQLLGPLPPQAVAYEPEAPLLPRCRHLRERVADFTPRPLSRSGGHALRALKVCLDDEVAMELLTEAGDCIAQGSLPACIADAMRLSQFTALRKPSGKVRGVAAGDTRRRLVGKTLARQYKRDFLDVVAPANFDLCDRSGTDALAHMLRVMSEADSRATITSIDGVEAPDHVLRSRIFADLRAHPSLRDLLPHIRLWYGQSSRFMWRDESGQQHTIEQGEGGEQGDALMPALFSLALHPESDEIQRNLWPGELVVAYLDDICLVTAPERARHAHDIAAAVLRSTCGIEVDQGKLASWCRRGGPAPRGLAELETARHTVWRGETPAAHNGLMVVGSHWS